MNHTTSCTMKALLLVLVSAGTTLTAYSQISVRSPLSDDREVLPGQTYEGSIIVHNETNEMQEAKVYQTDYLFHSNGTNEYGTPGSSARSNARWIELAPHRVVLPPGETVPIHYVVTVPETDSRNLRGTFWSMVMVEAIPKESPESTLSEADADDQYALRQIMRYGIQIATHLPDDGETPIDIGEAALASGSSGQTILEFTLKNSGSRLAQPEVWVDVYDMEGNSQGRLSGSTNRIYPETSVRQRIPLGTLAGGTYRALVFVDAGGDGVFAAEYDLEIEQG